MLLLAYIDFFLKNQFPFPIATLPHLGEKYFDFSNGGKFVYPKFIKMKLLA